ncbi:c-type cytochrome [bacterium]|nr:c-type cytochrome [bacterium]MBU1982954.1 c-type cytochrome [bacterium]
MKVLPWLLVVALAVVWLYREREIRHEIAALKTTSSTQAATAPDLRALAQNTELAKQGKALFEANCASCHGSKGYGDGPQAATISPKPRNYHTDNFKFGDDVVSIYNTLLKGSPGTSMPSFSLKPPEELFALVHYVRTLIPNPTPTTAEILARLPSTPGAMVIETGPRIPIELAMQRMAVPPETAKPATYVAEHLPGAAIYRQRCAACHGDQGQGAPQQVLSVAPYRYQATASLIESRAAWTHNRNRFAEIVVKGLPGRLMPGSGTLSQKDIDELHRFMISF